MNEIQVGDIVKFDESFYDDPHCFMSIVQCNPALDQLSKASDVDFSAWFQRLEATVLNFHHDMIEVETEMLFQRIVFSCYPEELIATGERIIPNDPSRYARTLFEV